MPRSGRQRLVIQYLIAVAANSCPPPCRRARRSQLPDQYFLTQDTFSVSCVPSSHSPLARGGALISTPTRFPLIRPKLNLNTTLISKFLVYNQQAWNQQERSGRAESAYSYARSESASEYSRRAWDSTASFDDDLVQTRPDSAAPSNVTGDQYAETEHDSLETISNEEHAANNAGAAQPHMSMLGPKTRHVTRAPWEPGGGDDLEEEDEAPEAETRSLFGGRGRPKKSKEFAKPRQQFPASFAPRASSSSRPSVDASTANSSSSGGRVRQTGRPGSAGTSYSNGSEALPFPSPRYERPVVSSPRRAPRDLAEQDTVSHPYANPSNASTYEGHTGAHDAVSPTSLYPPPSPLASKPSSNDHTSHSHISAPTRDIPKVPIPRTIPQKMAPWQQTPSSPTFQLVSLEEAQALKARQRQMSLGAAAEPPQRLRTVSGPVRKPNAPPEHSNSLPLEDGSQGRVLRGRKSLINMFWNKDKDRPRPESPPPVPTLPGHSSPGIGNTTPVTPLAHAQTPTTAMPDTVRGDSGPKAPRRVPPPSLNVVVTSPQPLPRHQQNEILAPPSIPYVQKSATPPPSFTQRKPVRKQSSAATLSPTEGLYPKPNSAPSTIQGFQGLSVRPLSTMFSSMPADYLSNPAPAPLMSHFPSSSNSAQFSTQSPTTPSLWSSRSESISTGSSEQPPNTPGGLVNSMSATSSIDGGATSISMMQRQIYGGKDVWKSQITDLEAQIRALKDEVAHLRNVPCPECGHFGGGASCAEKTSVLNRPRPKAAAGTNRTLFGAQDRD